LWQAGIERFDELHEIDWDWLSMDGAMRHPPRWEEKRRAGIPPIAASLVSSVAYSTYGHGVPIAVEIEGANRHDMKLTRSTLEGIVVERPEPTKAKPQGMCLDKGYDYDEVRTTIKEFGFTAHIRSRGNEIKALAREAGFKARRWVVERTHSWMNRFRRLLVRWKKKPENYLAFVHFVCGLIALRATGLFG
jgi:putative transposase